MTGSAATTSRRGAAADMEKTSINLAEELVRLSAATIFELRGEWRRLHRMPPPMRLSRDRLMPGITYKLQERPLGGLSKSILRELEGLNVSGAQMSHVPVFNEIGGGGRRAGKGKRLIIANGATAEVNQGIVELIK